MPKVIRVDGVELLILKACVKRVKELPRKSESFGMQGTRKVAWKDFDRFVDRFMTVEPEFKD